MKLDIEETLAFIAASFKHRELPKVVVDEEGRETDIYQDARIFTGKRWTEVTCAELQEYSAAIFGFSPEAFCYFLPGIYTAGLREERPDLLMSNAIVGGLNRGNAPDTWDEFFAKRWPQLSPDECEATQKWLLWLSESGQFEDIVLSRAFDTLELLRNQKNAIPIASWVRPSK